jgi:hypothetical protein
MECAERGMKEKNLGNYGCVGLRKTSRSVLTNLTPRSRTEDSTLCLGSARFLSLASRKPSVRDS